MVVRTLLAGICCAGVMMPALSSAQEAAEGDAGHIYVEPRVGLSLYEDGDVTTPGFPEVTVEYDTGWVVGGAVGYAFDFGLRGEVDLGYRKADVKEGKSGGQILPASGSLSVFNALANLVYEVDFNRVAGDGGNPSPVRPFVGGGLGAAVVDDDDGDNDTVFAYQAIAGVAWHVSPSWALTATYTYFGTDDAKLDDSDLSYSSHNFMAGIRLKF